LVATINQSAIQLDAAARQTQALASHLARASSAQSKQIASASESIGAMAASIEEVSGNAERAADVARHSVDVAHKGGDAVRRTIDGMNTIRETMQETSKRIKRLGEALLWWPTRCSGWRSAPPMPRSRSKYWCARSRPIPTRPLCRWSAVPP